MASSGLRPQEITREKDSDRIVRVRRRRRRHRAGATPILMRPQTAVRPSMALVFAPIAAVALARGIRGLRALAAAEALARDGIEAEVVDLRSLRPLDMETIEASVARTRRAVIVYEGVKTMGIGAEIAARLSERLEI